MRNNSAQQMQTLQWKFVNWVSLAGLMISMVLLALAISQIQLFFQGKDLIFTAWGDSNPNENQEIVIYSATNREINDGSANILGISSTPALSEGSASSGKLSYESLSYQAWLLDQYLAARNSPLAGHGEDFVNACREYGAPRDCTLLPAISRIETAYCTAGLSLQQYNCWGFGGSGPNRIWYNSFEQSIDDITRRLMIGYTERFFRDPNWGGLTYCGAHCVNWGTYVAQEQENIKAYYIANGFTDF